MATAVLTRTAPVVRTKKVRHDREHFEIITTARGTHDDRHFLLIQGGGQRGKLFDYLTHLVADGKAAIRWNHKRTRYTARLYIVELSAVKLAAHLKQLVKA